MEDDKPSPRADLWWGLAWIMLGLSIVWGGWTMDRLAHLSIPVYSIPGLVPMLLGAVLALMGTALLLRAIGAGALAQRSAGGGSLADHWRLLLLMALCLAFAVGMVGRGLPFWLAAAIFIAVFVFIFEYQDRRASRQLARGALIAAVHGLITGLVVQYVFEDLFLLRLP